MDEQQSEADHPETKRAIIERNQAAATRLNAALSRLTDGQLIALGALSDWSLRDVPSHIGNQWLAELLESHLEGRALDALAAWGTTEPPGPEFDMTSNDGRNAWQQQYALRYRDFVGEVRPASEGETGFPLWQWIRGDYRHHLEDHLPAFKAAAQAARG